MRAPFLVMVIACFCLSIHPSSALAAPAGSAAFTAAIDAAKAEMFSDPNAALRQAETALAATASFSGREQQIARATALWLQIEANIGLNRPDAAKAVLAEAIGLARAAAPQSKLHGDLIRSQGAIAVFEGNASEALRSYLEAHRIFQTAGDRRAQAIVLQDIGQIYWEAGDYERMLAYYADAQEIYFEDPGVSLGANNNRGEAYRLLQRWPEAEQAFTAALANARELDSPMLQTRILTNLALVQVEMGKLDEARRNAQLAERLGNSAEARDWRHFVNGVRANIAIAQGNDEMAATFIDRLFAGIDLTQTDLNYRDSHKTAADIHSRLGNHALALRHLQAFQRLDGEVRDLVTSTSSQLLEARFSSANQRTRIAELRQGQLQRDIEIARQRETITTSLLLAAFALLVVGAIAINSIRRSRNEVRDANAVLTQVNEKLELALKAKTDFLAMTSHEIRTPLNGIMGMTQVILADERIDQSTRERVGLVLGAGQTMQSLVDDLLDVAKMEGGEISTKREVCDLSAILTESVQLWRGDAQTKGLAIELDIAAAPTLAFTDGGRLRQVIFNLLANAIKFTPHGTVWLSAAVQDDQSVEILVRDSGIGIPEDQLELVFEAFHQVDNAMSRDFGGAGLGLAICRNIITKLGGTITVTSEVGVGSTFRTALPIGREVSAGDLDPEIPLQAPLQVTLVLDGDILRQAKVKAVLEPHVAAVTGAQTIDDARRLLELGGIALMVIDTSAMLDTEEHRKALRSLLDSAKARAAASILLVPADYAIDQIEEYKLGADMLLSKPLRPSILVAATGRLLHSNVTQLEAA